MFYQKKLQLKSIDNLGFFLKKGGKMLLMESSINAQKNINKYRKIFNLHKITPPWHNLFLDDEILKKYRFKNVKLKKIENFSSNFYFITRIIYAAYAKLKILKLILQIHLILSQVQLIKNFKRRFFSN